eukprot:1837047-Karenia_brevis.AAC.1
MVEEALVEAAKACKQSEKELRTFRKQDLHKLRTLVAERRHLRTRNPHASYADGTMKDLSKKIQKEARAVLRARRRGRISELLQQSK